MALTTYYMLCRPSDDRIFEYRLTNNFGVEDYPNQMVVRFATFSTDPGDSPDVLLANPEGNGTFVAPSTYTAPSALPANPYLKAVDWSGDGAADSDDGVWEMTSDGVNACTITVKKWDRTADAAIQEIGDKFGICIIGSVICLTARITLDANGEATITLTPTAVQKGEQEVVLKAINKTYGGATARCRFV